MEPYTAQDSSSRKFDDHSMNQHPGLPRRDTGVGDNEDSSFYISKNLTSQSRILSDNRR